MIEVKEMVEGDGRLMKSELFELKKKGNSDTKYDRIRYDFALESELTVTITLKEYRDLLTNVFRAEQDVIEYRNDRWKAEEKAEKLKDENLKLKEQLRSLQEQEEQ